MYKVDGVFSNRWHGSGLALPRTKNPQDPAARQYTIWYQKRLFDLWTLWDAEIKAVNPQRHLHREFRRRRVHRVKMTDKGKTISRRG